VVSKDRYFSTTAKARQQASLGQQARASMGEAQILPTMMARAAASGEVRRNIIIINKCYGDIAMYACMYILYTYRPGRL